MSKHNSVPVQKGPIVSHELTMGQMNHSQRVHEQLKENELCRSCQNMTLHEPKTSSKK